MKLTAKHGAESGDTASAADCQGTSAVIRKYPQLSADLDDGEEQTTRPLCNKETGGKKKTDSVVDSWTLFCGPLWRPY